MSDNREISEEKIKYDDIESKIAKLGSALAEMDDRLKTIDISKSKSKSRSSALERKMHVAIISIALLLISTVVCSYAYFVETTFSGGNTITAGRSDVTVYDITDPSQLPDPSNPDVMSILPDAEVSKIVYVTNSGTTPVYVRAKITERITLDERYADHQNEVDLSLVSYDIDYANWTELDGYYYFNAPVNAGESTTNLISQVIFSEQMGNIYKDSLIYVTVLLEVVQSNGNGATVFDAVGWTSATEGGAP